MPYLIKYRIAATVSYISQEYTYHKLYSIKL